MKIYNRPPKKSFDTQSFEEKTRFMNMLTEKLRRINPTAHLWAEQVRADARSNRDKVRDWKATPLRVDTHALIETFQQRHADNTGKPISKADMIAALMLHGIDKIKTLPAFKMKIDDDLMI